MLEQEQFELIEKLIERKLSRSDTEKLQNFVQLFKFYNSHTNLVSKNDEKNLFEKHIYDSLSLGIFIRKYKINQDAKILDVGTGGGFPSIPLSILYPELQIYPLDSIAKKIGFIELVQKELRLENIYPVCKRVEELPTDFRQSFDIVTSRAVASLNTLLEYTIPFVKTGSYFVAYKSKNSDQEIQQAENAFKILNSHIEYRIKYDLPYIQDHTRELIVIKKDKDTQKSYPRKSGQAKKNPL